MPSHPLTGVPVAALISRVSPRILLALSLALPACGARSELALPSGDAGAAPGTCPGSPDQPAVLAEVGMFEQFQSPTAITVAGPAVYYTVNDGSNNPLALYRLPIAGGKPVQLVAGVPGCANSPFGYGLLVTDNHRLYTPDEEMITTCAGAPLRITSIDPATGATSPLPDPADPAQRAAIQVRATATDGIFWLRPVTFLDPSSPGDTQLARWDGANAAAVAAIPGRATDFVIAAGQAFVQTRDTLYAVPLVDAHTAAALDAVDDKFTFIGSNQEAIFYSPDGASLVRRDALSGTTKTLLPSGVDTHRRFADPTWADEAWVYFIRDPQRDLARVPAAGGDVEVLSPADGREGVTGVVTDDCNVYWLAGASFSESKPPAVYARRK